MSADVAWVPTVPALTSPLFPAQVDGAVTLQAAIDAREGDRLPLEVALYIAAELAHHVAELNALGRGVGAIDPKRVWCTRQGAVWVPETSEPSGDGAGLGRLVYRLLSGAGEVTAWPPSYYNPAVDPSLDAAVMAAVSGEGPQDAKAMVEAVKAASVQLEPSASIDGMARLVLAVADDGEAPAPRAPTLRPATLAQLPVAEPTGFRALIARGAAAPLAVASLVVLFAAMILLTAAHRDGAPLPAAPEAAKAPAIVERAPEPVVAKTPVLGQKSPAPKAAAGKKQRRR